MSLIKAYIACLLVFLIADSLWLGFVAKDFYFTRLDHLVADKPNLAVAAGFYLIYIGCVIILISQPMIQARWQQVLGRGAVLGLLAYGTYNLTNMATLRDWPVAVSLVDMVWGVSLTALLSWVGWYVMRRM